jgi:hypothetical protein
MKRNQYDNSLIAPGAFVVGCNYWASHAGTAMWSDWQPEVVEQDLKQLADEGVQVLRVFPLWPDFQPICQLFTGNGTPREIRWGEKPLSDDEFGRAGVSEEMVKRFRFFADTAAKNKLKLIVGLITGWMSGRLFVPPALERRNIHTDPVALMWQVRYVKCLVKYLKDHAAIQAWDLGNECNCMAATGSREAAYVWTAQIAHTIRSEDQSRPVVSGMHGIKAFYDSDWTIFDQGELTDLLTTHPYPRFTPHCGRDPMNQIRNCLHATAESRYYADLGGKPCIAEEVGTLGPMTCDDEVAGDYARTALFSLWAHDCQGMLWWCAYDQTKLEHAPYDWVSLERELGLIREDRTPKTVIREMGKFRKFLNGLPFANLPARRGEAVCVLTKGQDCWGAAFSSFILSRQAGFSLEFQQADQPLKESKLYLLPCLSGGHALSRRCWLELMEKARQGATVYISFKDDMPSHFTEMTGLQVITRHERHRPAGITFTGVEGMPSFAMNSPVKLNVRSVGAEILAREGDGNPVFARFALGKGQVFFFSFPMEEELAKNPGAFHEEDAAPCWRIYRHLAKNTAADRVLSKSDPRVGVTEHLFEDGSLLAVLINHSPDKVQTALEIAPGWSILESCYGDFPLREGGGIFCHMPPNDAVVLKLGKGKK